MNEMGEDVRKVWLVLCMEEFSKVAWTLYAKRYSMGISTACLGLRRVSDALSTMSANASGSDSEFEVAASLFAGRRHDDNVAFQSFCGQERREL